MRRMILSFPLSLMAILALGNRAFAAKPAAAEKPAAAPAAKKPATPRVLVTISKQTTYITGPLRKDGYVDYVAALNALASKGVTPENNAAVLLWKALGPHSIQPADRENYFKRLGIAPLPEQGDYFVPFVVYMQQVKAARQTPDAAPSDKALEASEAFFDSDHWRPWSAKEFPILAHWLAANEKPLALVMKATTRPRRFDPLIASDKTLLIAVLLPAVQNDRSLAHALVLRAMLRLNDRDATGAWSDLFAVHRLGRLAGQGATLIDALVGIGIEGIACGGDQAFLQYGHLSAAAAMRMAKDLDRLPPPAKMIEIVDNGERFTFLDAVAMVARGGLDQLTNLTGPPGKKSPEKAAADAAIMAGVDWNVVLQMGNSQYDRLVVAMRKPTFVERKEALAEFDLGVRKLAAQAEDWKSLVFPLLSNPKDAVSRRIGEIFIAMLLPAISSVNVAEERGSMRFAVTKLGFALAAYRADHGAYPERLAALAPKYMANIPQDAFIAGDLHYRRKGDGYLLYSVGRNGIDDGGKGIDDVKNGESWDDLAIRVTDPAAAKH